MSQALTVGQGKCEKIVVTTADGRTYDLGSPDSRLFPIRCRLYIWKRRNEFNA